MQQLLRRFSIQFLAVLIIMITGRFSSAVAHPHIFIESRVEIVFDDQGLAGIQMQWVFDEMTSSGFIVDYDTDRDGAFSVPEAEVLKREGFDYLKNYEYMTHIEIDGKPFKVRYVKDFKPVIKKDLLVYHFFIPCHVKASRHPKRVSLAVYDEEYYVDYSQDKTKVKLLNSEGFETSLTSGINPEKSYYFEQFHPYEFILHFNHR